MNVSNATSNNLVYSSSMEEQLCLCRILHVNVLCNTKNFEWCEVCILKKFSGTMSPAQT